MTFEDENVKIAAGEEQRIQDALAALAKDPHAPREISVRFILHIHNEYPKHVTVGKDKDGVAITQIVANEAEEAAVLAGVKQENDDAVTNTAAPVTA